LTEGKKCDRGGVDIREDILAPERKKEEQGTFVAGSRNPS
jgi:hypothetical protein